MKAIYKNIALAALALSAVACTQEEDFSPSFLNDPDAVRITAQVASGNVTGGFTRSNPLGTTEEQAKFNDGDQIAVTADGQDAVTYTFNGTTWTPEEGKYLKWVDNSMNFTAWYPVGEGTNANTFTVPISYADVDAMAAADYMVYSGSQNKTNGNDVTLPMERKMARIVITPILNDEFSETNYSITGIKVHANTCGYANGEPQTGSIQVSALKQGNAYYALLAPTTAADATFLTVTVTKTDDSTSQELTVKGIPATVAGKSYEYTLTVGKDKATIGNVTVNSWNDGTINGGKAEEVPTYCYLPEPDIDNESYPFTDAILAVLDNNSQLTEIEFKANINEPSGTQIGTCGAYLVANEETLEIHTSKSVFVFPGNCASMFNGLEGVTSIKFNDCIDTSNVTSMNNMFRSLSALKELDLRCFNTSNVTDMGLMFAYCSKLEMLNLSSFNVGNVEVFTDMLWMMSKLENGKKTKVYVPNPNPFVDKNTGINTDFQGKPADSEYAEYVIGTP